MIRGLTFEDIMNKYDDTVYTIDSGLYLVTNDTAFDDDDRVTTEDVSVTYERVLSFGMHSKDVDNTQNIVKAGMQAGLKEVIAEAIQKGKPKGFVPISLGEMSKIKDYKAGINTGVIKDMQKPGETNNDWCQLWLRNVRSETVEVDGKAIYVTRDVGKFKITRKIGENNYFLYLCMANHEKKRVRFVLIARSGFFKKKQNLESVQIEPVSVILPRVCL
jgi:hypothetical protein